MKSAFVVAVSVVAVLCSVTAIMMFLQHVDVNQSELGRLILSGMQSKS